ncbi:hypothetical protein [Catenuloplanes atrovinosus]|uniref:Uncharacterized protein n=1 Tax=Catenuloplanes atrovinosus TaxID=137266 RepID=A0AAE3YNX6_9ACTN|nr:hypothetical protein [Catenuloplanes atrovinosus]MDR7275574.1 hypothetical protein [Catenuloplanes atrovinosus]
MSASVATSPVVIAFALIRRRGHQPADVVFGLLGDLLVESAGWALWGL